MMRKDDPAFKKAVDDSIEAMVKSGELAKMYDKWFMQPIPPANTKVGLPLSEATKNAWANPNDKPMEDYAVPVDMTPARRRRRRRRPCAIGAASMADSRVALFLTGGLTMQGGGAMSWDWQVFFQDTGGGQTYLHWMMSAWGWTLLVSGCSLVVALSVGSLMGILRTTPNKAFVLDRQRVDRALPQHPAAGADLPLVPRHPVDLSSRCRACRASSLVVLALGFFTSARIAEQVKAGIQALPKGQRYAGLAMGLTLPQTYRYVLLPMAFRIVIPPLTSESMNIIKNSSVAFAVSIAELTIFAMQAQEETSRGIEIYLAVTVLYFVSAFAVNRVALFIEKRVQVPGMIGGGKR